jgi:hypothetical protein
VTAWRSRKGIFWIFGSNLPAEANFKERPCRRATNERDELAPCNHSMTSPTVTFVRNQDRRSA